MPLLVLPSVFNPVLFRTGAILARTLHRVYAQQGAGEGRTALDVGTGSGVGAVFAALRGFRVVGVDVNPEAVRCARVNALLNGVEARVEIREGDLFAPLEGERYDLVLFNPPFYRGEPRDARDRAWRSTDLMERFAAGLPDHLAPGGHALVVVSTDGEGHAIVDALAAVGLEPSVVERKDLGNEVVTVYSAGPGAVTVGRDRRAQ